MSDEFIDDRKEGGHRVNYEKFKYAEVKYVNSMSFTCF